MNKIHTLGTNPQDEIISPKKEVITWNTWAEIEQSLSEAPLTTDEKINQLTDDVNNLNNGLKELIELSKLLMKSQIENVSTIEDLKKSIQQSINTSDNKTEWIRDSLIKEINQQSNKIVTAQETINKKIIDRQSIFAEALIEMIAGLEYETIDYKKKEYAGQILKRIK